ncbi:hypothetical protein [Candidatus Phytoplasma pruni]|uniref:Peptidase M41 domain-containing protein n=1 Tax=Candidatus Phytoplasma pruni TaxID=479893 RepID=A0A851H9V7_9MOLU|nr:hypothetical protein [Candidatus Phytoplasma pruni]NWN45722.1 hypothetical protein [Candidatus Phytoplasma pruni]
MKKNLFKNIYFWFFTVLLLLAIESVVIIILLVNRNDKPPISQENTKTETEAINFNDWTKIKNEKLLKTAVHEGAHAVSVLSLDQQIDHMKITPQTANIDGLTAYYRKDDKDMNEQDYLNEIIINLSGRAGEVLLFGSDGGKHNYVDDERHAKGEIDKMFNKFPNNRFLTQRVNNKEKAKQDVLDDCYNQAKERLIKHKLIWKIIIQMLFDKGELNLKKGFMIDSKMESLKPASYNQRSWVW